MIFCEQSNLQGGKRLHPFSTNFVLKNEHIPLGEPTLNNTPTPASTSGAIARLVELGVV